MKLFSALLAASLLAAATAPEALAKPTGCRAHCGGADISRNNGNTDNSGHNRNNSGIIGSGNRVNNGTVNRRVDRSNTAHGGKGLGVGIGHGGEGGQGGQGGQGGRGGSATIERGAVRNTNRNRNENSNSQGQLQGQSQGQGQGQSQSSRNRNQNNAEGGDVRNSGNSRNANSNRSNSRSAANNNGNNQSTTVNTGGNSYTEYGDLPETAVAPLGQSAGSGVIGDIAVPLPTISAGGFASGSSYDDIYGAGGSDRSDYGVSIGINIPLGAGEFRDAARREIARRDDLAQAQQDRNLFRLVQEAQWLRQQGLLSEQAHPRHWEALYGAADKFAL